MSKLTFLHITDCHLADQLSVETIDIKLKGAGIAQPSRIDVLKNTLCHLRDHLLAKGQLLDAVLVSGDGTFKGDNGGQLALRELILDVLGPIGLTQANLVVTPGNHDIVAGTAPGSPERYKLFKEAWIDPGSVVVPFLDGIHDINNPSITDHVLRHPEGHWAIFPINSCNWSQLRLAEKENRDVGLIRRHLETSGDVGLLEAFDSLCSYDIARISDAQSRVLKDLIKQTGNAKLRIAMLHHHLLPVDSREEFKPFCDITNLGHLRQLLRELGFHIVVHGHKHTTGAYFDYISPDSDTNGKPHRILTVSGGTFAAKVSVADSTAQFVTIDDILHAPKCAITSIGVAKAGRELARSSPRNYRLWESDPGELGPAVIAGHSIDEAYRKVLQTVETSPDRPIVCTINFDETTVDPFPVTYPYGKDDDERREWFKETVSWWQLPASRIELRIPYIHGSRLKRYGGGLNQIKRIIELLGENTPTSKAIALVVDPARDFVGDTAFASFCLVQFCLRPARTLECIGYYRTQEFNYWWPVNVAELRRLQNDIATELNLKCGKITTITPYPRLSENVRSPTKVAVPLIDQWVDNHPGRIAQIALALSDREDNVGGEGLIYWARCLDDLERGTQSFHTDGVAVAIEGLVLLKEWLVAIDAPEEVISHVVRLHDVNDAHRKMDSKGSFNRWQGQVTPLLAALREFPKPKTNSEQ